jgi:hypothetical protein
MSCEAISARQAPDVHAICRYVIGLIVTLALGWASSASSEQIHRFPLTSVQGLTLHNVTARPVPLDGRPGLRVAMSDEAQQKFLELSSAERAALPEQLVIIDDLQFGDGVIEAEIAGEPMPDAFEGARGFVGIAFRLQTDRRTYDSFYIRPTNGRAEDQLRRNHSAQYISHPEWTWSRLRKEAPGMYESYVDVVPGEWTKVKIEVRGAHARLFVHGAEQPTLIVKDLKTGPSARGSIALWIDDGTVAHFRNVIVYPAGAAGNKE